ncbi:MAG: MBL fold metallo-hydrolase [Bacteroidota bacterium]
MITTATDTLKFPLRVLFGACLMTLFAGLFAGNCYSQSVVPVKENRVSDHVKVFNIEGPQSTNIVVIDTDEGLVVIDSETSPVFAQAIRNRIDSVYNGKTIRYLINTHDHGDHTYGNQVFADAIIIGHDRCKEEMIKNQASASQTVKQVSAALQSMKARLEKLDINSDAARQYNKIIAYYEGIAKGLGDGFALTPPQITFSDRLELDLGNVSLSLQYIGGLSHSYSDILVFCPEEQLLVTGDLIYKDNLYFDSERIPFLGKWIEALESVLANKEQIHFIVPGHEGLLPLSILEDHLRTIREKQKEFSNRESALLKFKKEYETNGLAAAIKLNKKLFSDSTHYYFLHPEFDQFAYRLMLDNKLPDALEMFTQLVGFFPESYIAFDSLGEIYLRMDQKDKARDSFKKSLVLNPDNENAKNQLEQLK